MKTGQKQKTKKKIKITYNEVIDLGVLVVDAAITIPTHRLIKKVVESAVPEPEDIKLKIVYKIGQWGLSTAVGSVLSDKVNDLGDKARAILAAKYEPKTLEEDEDGFGDTQTELE